MNERRRQQQLWAVVDGIIDSAHVWLSCAISVTCCNAREMQDRCMLNVCTYSTGPDKLWSSADKVQFWELVTKFIPLRRYRFKHQVIVGKKDICAHVRVYICLRMCKASEVACGSGQKLVGE